MRLDVVIIGGGPAGLSAALILGRCCRSVLVIDSGEPRNSASRGLHGYLTQDGMSPQALRESGREEVQRYPTVAIRDLKVIAARRDGEGFEVQLSNQETIASRLLLLATGRVDPLPDVCGAAEFFGRGVYHCPYCDGYEHRDAPLGVLGVGHRAVDLAAELCTWSQAVTLYTNGSALPRESRGNSRRSFSVVTRAVSALRGSQGMLEKILLDDGTTRDCEALFFCSDCRQRSLLPQQLGCEFDAEQSVVCRGHAASGVTGLFVAGNVRGGVHLAITAAAEGAEAGMAMNEVLLAESPLAGPYTETFASFSEETQDHS